jgi:hypothetical protein
MTTNKKNFSYAMQKKNGAIRNPAKNSGQIKIKRFLKRSQNAKCLLVPCIGALHLFKLHYIQRQYYLAIPEYGSLLFNSG